MTLNAEGLGSFGDLAKAVGLLEPSGDPNSSWFGDPVGAEGSGGNQHGLRHVLADDDQRNALLSFVDGVLGPPDRATRAGQTWVPLFAEQSPHVTISAVVQEVDGQVRVGVGLEHSTSGGLPHISTRVHVPVLRVAQRNHTLPTDTSTLPEWLMLGRAGGRVEVGVDATFTETAPAPGAASLGGVGVAVGIPTSGDDDLSISLQLKDLQLPGATAPRTFTLDAHSLDELGTDVLELITGLVRAQVDALDLTQPQFRVVGAIAGLLGLRDVTGVPALPLSAIPTQGINAVVGWIEQVLADHTARDAWLGQLAVLIGGSVDAGNDSVFVQFGPMRVAAGLRVEPGTAGHPVLTPFVEVALDTRGGVKARLHADLLRADTGTGSVHALPDARLEAVFGADAGGSPLLGSTDPHVGSLHVGIRLDATQRPAFLMTLHDVTVGGATHALLDLSSPQAAMDSASSLIESALANAIAQLGSAGTLINGLLGLDPPTGVAPLSVTGLLADPLGAVLGYWRDLLNHPTATADILGRLRALLTNAAVASVPGAGTAVSPWRVDLVGDIAALFWLEDQVLVAELAFSVSTPVLTDYAATALAGLTLLRLDLTSGSVTFASQARGSLSFGRADTTIATVHLGALTIEARSLAATVRWTPAHGLRATFDADGLAVTVAARSARPGLPARMPLSLPTLDGSGRLTLPTLDWAALERVLAGLLAELKLPVIDALVDLVGWNGSGAHLDLVGLMTGDAVATVRAWLADLILDCGRVRYALGPVAALLSGFRLGGPFGSGNARSPYRCPVAGEPRAPGLAVWLDPGCPPPLTTFATSLAVLIGRETPRSPTIAAVLQEAGQTLPDVADLMVGRDSLADGFDTLVSRWAGTDGLAGRPTSLPDGVAAVDVPFSYAELVALGASGLLAADVFDTLPSTVLHVGVESTWDRSDPAYLKLPEHVDVADWAQRITQALSGRVGPITVFAYGPAGAAAIRAAATVTAIASVVTVGSAWSDVSVDSLRSGLGGDALRLLQRLRQTDRTPWPDPLLAREATPQERMLWLVQRCTAYTAGDLPSAGVETRRSGLDVRAVFGALDPEDLLQGVGALVAEGLRLRLAAAEAAADAGGSQVALHAGVDIPVIDLNLGGLLAGVGLTLELCRIGSALDITVVRGVIVDVHFGVHDGWLLGGPGTSGASGDLRWMSARVEVPLDGRPGDAELVLHEATGLGIDRERWVVRAGDATPEVRLLLSGVVGRLRAASPDLGALLDGIGLSRDGGLDPDGLDRLLHDTATTMRACFSANPGAIAGALRALVSAASGSGSSVQWTVGPGTIGVDLATGAVNVALSVADAGIPPLEIDVIVPASGNPSASVAFGAIDPQAGGLRLVARTAPTPSVVAEWSAPNGPLRTVTLVPTPDVTGLRDLATVALPAALAQCLANVLRGMVSTAGRATLDAALDAIGLLGAPDASGGRAVIVPIGLFQDPGGWLRHGITAWRANAATSAVALLDALAPLVVPGRGTNPGWPLASGVAIAYSVESANRLRLVADVTLHFGSVTTHVAAGLLIGPDALPAAVVDASIDIDGRGLQLTVGGTPPVQLSLVRPLPATAIPLYPNGPGLGQALSAIGETVLPPVLNAIAGHRTDGGSSLIKDLGQAVYDLGGALDLLESNAFTGPRITAFANDPAAALTSRLPQLVTTAVASLANALDPAHTIVTVTGPAANVVTLGFGHGQPVQVVLDASGVVPAIEVRADATIAGIGRFTLERLRLSTAGVDIAARLGPVVLDVGAFSLRPVLYVRAGSASGSRLVGLGLALDDAGERSVQVRWALDSTPPDLVAVHLSGATETPGTAVEAVQWLLGLGLSLAGGVLVDGLRDALGTKAKACLRGVVFTDVDGSTQLDPNLALDILDPAALLGRLKRLLWNAADAPALSLTIDSTVTLSLSSLDLGSGRKALGLDISLAAGHKLTLADGDTKVELEVDATWVDPPVAGGLGIYVLAGTSASTLDISPDVTISGIGLRFSKASGPLLSLGPIALDGIAVHVYGQAGVDGFGGGVNLELAGLAIAPAAGGGSNGVANSIMNDAGKSSPSSRPSFSPSLSVQKHPNHDLGVSLRAGPPPGPWWLVVQRQLGPLYLERIGFDTAETNGTVTRISLLFDGRVSIFGLTAAVDQLSISWLGGDVLDIHSWAVDLMGLAISADMSGVSLAGGILKTVGPPDNGPVSYVGMLLGRFGVYGLTVFGGYTNDNGSPSFFIFGGVNGPIGGPPAFFVTGIGGGLGINRALRIPEDPSTFNEFPFIQALDPAAQPPADPMAELRKLNLYFGVEHGTFWFAAGISFNCFTLVDGIAVVAVSFGNGLDINLLGLARMALPRPQAALVSIELGLLARFSTSEGIFLIRAALTANSWLLYRDVRLTGGFAFVIWWKGPLSGQFVLTLGGYHPDFHRDGYPDVPRLGLMWKVTDDIVIKGGSYFALTSEALMAGVDVEVSADFGWAWAKVQFGAHGIVYFDPFWFDVMIYARISAGIEIDTFLGTISISISLGAKVEVWGPEFSGRASFEVGPCDLSVGFGSERKIEGKKLTWPEFVAKYLEDAGNGTARALSSITGKGTLPSATGGDRSAPTADGTADKPFEVYSEFELTVVTTIPVTSLDLAQTTGPAALPVSRSDGLPGALGLKPMKTGGLGSTLRISLERKDDTTGVYGDATASLRLLASDHSEQSFPVGTWGTPDPEGMPSPPLPKGDVLNASSNVRLEAVAQQLHRGPEIDYYRVEASRRPLPLQASGSSRAAMVSSSNSVSPPPVSTVDEALTRAQAILAGARSNLASASYKREVAAPPLFGTLAEGIAPVNAADGSAQRVAPPPAPVPRELRAPVVTGFLSPGTAAARRASTTTVSNQDYPRRPAPTLDSVQARLGVQIPAALHVTAAPAAVTGDTVLVSRPPRTVVPTATRSYAPGSRALAGHVAAGDIVLLTLPDAAVDVAADAAAQRPALVVKGAARVVAMRGDGEVVLDAVQNGRTIIPERTAIVAVQGSPVSDDGLAGWHVGSRVAAIGTHTAIGYGCALTVTGLPTTPKAVVWATAGELIQSTSEIATRFTGTMRALALVVENASAQRLSTVDIELTGATAPNPPAVVMTGTQAVLVYELTGLKPGEPICVRVFTGAGWQITGMLGGDLSPDELTATIVRQGVAGAVGRLTGAGDGCELSWEDASGRSPQ